MPIKTITQNWNPILHNPSTDVTDFMWITQEIIANLIDTMRAKNLIGIAAPQIGIWKRIFVTEVRKTEFRNPEEIDQLRVYINPEIIWKSTELCNMYEWCWSVEESGLFWNIKRPESIIIKAEDINGNNFELKASGLLARVIQHENDHINGILFTEHTDKLNLISAEKYKSLVN